MIFKKINKAKQHLKPSNDRHQRLNESNSYPLRLNTISLKGFSQQYILITLIPAIIWFIK